LPILYIADGRAVRDASDLMAAFGEDAGLEARLRADHHRDRGNAVRFCHWRQVQRLVAVMGLRTAVGTVH